MDETGLFFRDSSSRKTYTLKGADCAGGKRSKERLTIALCASMTGEKYTPLIIGKANKPRCFNKIKPENLPVIYRANKKAWMNSFLFEDWLKKLDRKMKSQKRKILLFVDNAPSHPTIMLSNVKLLFLPPNTTSKTQPMDQGIIQTLKLKFRKRQLKHVLHQLNATDKSTTEIMKEISILQAIYWIDSSWNEVESSTIQKCFSKCGFNSSNLECETVESEPEFEPDDDIPLQVVKLASELFGCDFKDLSEIDEQLQSRDDTGLDFSLTAQELLDSLKSAECVGDDDDDNDDDDDACGDGDSADSVKVSVTEAQACVNKLKQFALQAGNHVILESVFKVEESMSDMLLTKSKQSSICDFFKRSHE